MTVLVTGATGTLGLPTVVSLRAAGHEVRALSRAASPGNYVGDLTSGEGLDAALTGADTVVHLATTARSKDVAQAQNLVDACRAAGVSHLVFISIVGVDTIRYPYYKAKRASERVIEESGIPFTILRATQFHDFIAPFVRMQRRIPVLMSLKVPYQPIAVAEVAERLVELVDQGPSGRVADIGGPEQLRLRDAMDLLQTAAGKRKPVVTLPLFGKTIAAFRRGDNMPGLPGYGRETFAEYVARGTNKA